MLEIASNPSRPWGISSPLTDPSNSALIAEIDAVIRADRYVPRADLCLRCWTSITAVSSNTGSGYRTYYSIGIDSPDTIVAIVGQVYACLLYTSDAADE